MANRETTKQCVCSERERERDNTADCLIWYSQRRVRRRMRGFIRIDQELKLLKN